MPPSFQDSFTTSGTRSGRQIPGRWGATSFPEDDEDGSGSPTTKLAPNVTSISSIPDAYALGAAQAFDRNPSIKVTTYAAKTQNTSRPLIRWSAAPEAQPQKLPPFALLSGRPVANKSLQDRKESDATVWPTYSLTERPKMTLSAKETEGEKKDKSQTDLVSKAWKEYKAYKAWVRFEHRKSQRSGINARSKAGKDAKGPRNPLSLEDPPKSPYPAGCPYDPANTPTPKGLSIAFIKWAHDELDFMKYAHDEKRRSMHQNEVRALRKDVKLWKGRSKERKECKRQKREQQQELASPAVDSAVSSAQTRLPPLEFQADSSSWKKQQKNNHRKQSIYNHRFMTPEPPHHENPSDEDDDAPTETSPDAETLPTQYKTSTFARDVPVGKRPPTQRREAHMDDYIVSPLEDMRRSSSVYSQKSAGVVSPMTLKVDPTKNTPYSIASREVPLMASEDFVSDVKETRLYKNKPLPPPPKLEEAPRSKAQTLHNPPKIAKQQTDPNLREAATAHADVPRPSLCPQHTEPPCRFPTYDNVPAVRSTKPQPQKHMPAKQEVKPSKSRTNLFSAAKLMSKSHGNLRHRVDKSQISKPGPLLVINAANVNIADESGGFGGSAAAYANRAPWKKTTHHLGNAPVTPKILDKAVRDKDLPLTPPFQRPSREDSRQETAVKGKNEGKASTPKGNKPFAHFNWHWQSGESTDDGDFGHFKILGRKRTKSSGLSFYCIGEGNGGMKGYSPRGPYDSPLPRVSEDSQSRAAVPHYRPTPPTFPGERRQSRISDDSSQPERRYYNPAPPAFPRDRRPKTPSRDPTCDSLYDDDAYADFPKDQEDHFLYSDPRYVPKPLGIFKSLHGPKLLDDPEPLNVPQLSNVSDRVKEQKHTQSQHVQIVGDVNGVTYVSTSSFYYPFGDSKSSSANGFSARGPVGVVISIPHRDTQF